VLTRHKNPGKWAVARYQLLTTNNEAQPAAADNDDVWVPRPGFNNAYWERRYAERARWREAWRRGTLDELETAEAAEGA
jgi:hypothetical protein